MNDKPIEAELLPEAGQAVVKREEAGPVARPMPALEPKPAVTAAQAKVEAIASLTASAYSRASELRLTSEESSALAAPFQDEDFRTGAGGKEELIYIQHSALRDRLNKVLGLGQWTIVPRSRWAEDYEYFNKTTRTQERASRVYVEAMLLVRGCFVSESIGDMTYYPKNPQTNYGDAVEGATSEALRRCCKNFGIGLQAWDKSWCDGWWQRKRTGTRPAAPAPRPANPVPAPAPKPTPDEPKYATAATRDWLIRELEPCGPLACEYFIKAGQLLPSENLLDLPLRWVPVSKAQLAALKEKITDFGNGAEAAPAFPSNPEADPPKAKGKPKPEPTTPEAAPEDEAWRSFPMPWGKQAGTPLGDLEKNYLFGLWANYEVEREYNGKLKKPETIAKDEQFRAMLDLAGKHYEFKKKD